MKTLISKYWLVLMALVSVCMFSACSSDDDDAVTPVFPQVQKLAGAAGDEMDFTFEANTNWSLASSAIWCKMEQGENTDAFVLNGQAGKQTIKVKLTDDDASKDLSVAQLVLTMGDQKAAIAEVTRSAAGYSVTVFDEEGNDITETGVVVGYDDFIKFSVKANYRFAVTNTPNWVELEGGFMVGLANEETQGGVKFKEGVKDAKYAISTEEGYTITIASEDGKAAKTIPVRYNGMPTNTMNITYPTSSQWADWTVSMDGKTFSQTGSSSVADDAQTNTFTFTNFVPFTLKTFGDDFTLVVFQRQSWGLEPVYERFVTTTGEGGDIRLAVGATTSERECYVYALPTAEYESLGNPENMIDEEGNISWLYNNYFLMHFFQKDAKKDDAGEDEGKVPTVLVSGYKPISCAKETSGNYDVYAEHIGYLGKEIYYAEANNGNYISVNPNIDGWMKMDPDNPDAPMEGGAVAINGSGNPLDIELATDYNDNPVVAFTLTEDNAPCVIGFTMNDQIVKMIVVNVNWDAQSKKYNSIKRFRK